MTLGQRIKKARNDKQLTQKQLAKMINAKHNSISNWENDQNRPDADTIELLAGVLDVPVNYFFSSGANDALTLNEYDHIKKYRALDLHGKNLVDLLLDAEYSHQIMNQATEDDSIEPHEKNGDIRRPIYLLPASAGTGQFLDSSDYEMVDFPRHVVPIDSTFGVRVSGNSMEPQLYDGDIVFVKQCHELRSGDIGVFMLNGDGYIKQWNQDNDEITLVSLNRQYDPITLKEFDELRIVGKVLGKV